MASPFLNDFSTVQYNEMVTELCEPCDVMINYYHRFIAARFTNDGNEQNLLIITHVGCRLIQQENTRVSQQAASKREKPLLSSREVHPSGKRMLQRVFTHHPPQQGPKTCLLADKLDFSISGIRLRDKKVVANTAMEKRGELGHHRHPLSKVSESVLGRLYSPNSNKSGDRVIKPQY